MRIINNSKNLKHGQGQFTTKAILGLPHRVFVEVLLKLNKAKSAAYFSQKGKFAHNLQKSKLKEYSESDLSKYKNVTNNTVLWHGTGRYQHNGSNIIDVLNLILEHGAIKPAEDYYGLLVGAGKTFSISTTKSRIIARSYADTHGLGSNEKFRYGSAMDWVSYYYGMFYFELFTKKGITVMSNWKKWAEKSTDANKEVKWGKKVNKKASYVWDVFEMGTDIKGNYPIIFGITNYDSKIELPKIADKAEVRIGSNIDIKLISHIEVPEEKVSEVERLISEYSLALPVYSIELGEYAASKSTILELLCIDNT